MTRMLQRMFGGRPRTPPSTQHEQTTQQHNQQILQTSNVSHVTLPPMFVVWRHPNPERMMERDGLTHDQAYGAVCIVTTRIGGHVHPLWKLLLVEQPLEALGRCQVTLHPDNWLSGQTHTIIVQRPSSDVTQHNKLYLTDIRHSRWALRLESGQMVPILRLSQPCLVLANEFSFVDIQYRNDFGFVCDHGRELVPPTLIRRLELQREALRMAQRAARTLIEFANAPEPSAPEPTAPAPSTPSPQRPQPPRLPSVRARRATPSQPPQPPQQRQITRSVMPQHIVNTVIETLVAQGKECPITQEPLMKETSSLTPCGHTMTTAEAVRWIQGAHSCPECRSPCEVDQLQVWRA